MIRLRKEENWYGYENIIIETNEGIFEILYSGNDDLYWSLMYIGQRLDITNSFNFFITKENEYLYNSFEKLYTAIKDSKPFSNSDLDDKSKNMIVHENTLFKNGKIEWHSDDFPYEESSILTISKEGNIFNVEFRLSDKRNLFSTFSIRICNSGSRYYPYNVSFMNMYNELLEYDYEKDKMPIVSIFATDNKKKVKKL